jgi:hypothetical protein
MFVVIRNSNDETTLAVVEAKVVAGLTEDTAFLAALKKALTKWQQTTDEGKEAWEESSEDFNVGDLSNYELRKGTLRKLLAERGINKLEIDIKSRSGGMGASIGAWSYDTVLIEPEED